MPAIWVPSTSKEKLDLVQDLIKVVEKIDEKTRLGQMEKQLVAYGFLPKKDTNYLENLLKQYGWMLE